MEKGRKLRVSHFQWEIILDAVAGEPSIFTGYKNTARGRDRHMRMWRDLSRRLNSIATGATKSPQEWATWFNNAKSKLKKRVADIRTDTRGTGGGPAIAEALTEMELRLLQLMGPGFGEGLPGIQVDPFNQPSTSRATQPQDTAQDPVPDENEEIIYVVEVLDNREDSNISRPPLQEIEEPQQIGPDIAEADSPTRRSPRVPPQESPAVIVEADSPTRRPPRIPRRVRRATRPLAPLDEADRLLRGIEAQRVAAERDSALALIKIGDGLNAIAQSLARIANALERRD